MEDVLRSIDTNDTILNNFLKENIKYDQYFIDTITKTYLSSSLNSSIISKDCVEDVNLIISTLQSSITHNFTSGTHINMSNPLMGNFILPILDSFGKIDNGILLGNTISHGLMSECQNAFSTVPNRTRPLEGAFGRVSINIPYEGSPYNGTCIIGKIFTWDICVPKTCEKHNDMLNLVKSFNITKTNSSISPICDVGTFSDNPPFTFKGYIVGYLILFFVIWSIIGSLVDIYIVPSLKERESKVLNEKWFKIFQAMSLYTNLKLIFKLPKKVVAKNEDGKPIKGFVRSEVISTLHCIRTLSIIWVMMGHSLGFIMMISINPIDIFAIVGDYSKQFLPNAYFSVDSFFFMSGLLLSFMFFKSLKRNRRRTLSLNNWIMMYAHRILRLSPSYYMTIAFYTWVFAPGIINQMPIYITTSFKGMDTCDNNWWINFLYINNFVNVKDQCYLIAWYLATDFQIFLFSPIILIPLAINAKIGLFVSISVILLSTASNIVEVYVYYFPPSDFSYGWMDPRMGDYINYTEFMYSAPWIRCQIYIIGMLVGYFLQMKHSLKIPFIVNIIGWIVSLVIMVVDIVSIRDWVSGHEMDLFPRAMYSAFSKIGWGISLSFIVISCFYGHGGIVNRFMSWPFWSPLGKVSYSTYLIHLMVLLYIVGGMQGQFVFVSLWNSFIYIILPVIVISFFLAFFWCAIFEVGIGKIEDLLIDRRVKGSNNKVKDNNTFNGNIKTSDSMLCDKINEGWRDSISYVEKL